MHGIFSFQTVGALVAFVVVTLCSSTAHALGSTRIDISGDLAVTCGGPAGELGLVRLDGTERGTVLAERPADGAIPRAWRQCLLPSQAHVAAVQLIPGNPATTDLVLLRIPSLVEVDRLRSVPASVLARSPQGTADVYVQGQHRTADGASVYERRRYSIDTASERFVQRVSRPAAVGTMAVTDRHLIAFVFSSQMAEFYSLPDMGGPTVMTTVGFHPTSTDSPGASRLAIAGRDVLLLDGAAVVARGQFLYAQTALWYGDVVYVSVPAAGSLPARVQVRRVTDGLPLVREIPGPFAHDLAVGPDGIYQSSVDLGILRVERFSQQEPTRTPTTAPTRTPTAEPTRTPAAPTPTCVLWQCTECRCIVGN